MTALTKTNLYKFTNTTLTFSLGLLLFYFLFNSLNLEGVSITIDSLEFDLLAFICIAFAIILTLANWGIEAYKWNFLIKKVHFLSDRELISSIGLGLCANILAPNRTGELAARLNHIPSDKRRPALYLNLFSASSQLLVTFLLGIFSIMILLPQLKLFNAIGNSLAYSCLLLLAAASLIIFFKSKLLKTLLLKKLRRHDKLVESVDLDLNDRLKVLALSMLRYMIFVIQFYLILLALNARIQFIDATAMLAISFFVNSFIPSNWLTEVFSKGTAIYFLASFLNYDPLLAVTASFGLWLFNLFIPSSLSLYFLKDVNWLRLIRS